MAIRSARALLSALALVAASLTIPVLAAPAAHAATCTKLWTGAVSTLWDDKNNWSPNNAAPNATDVACLTSAGTYTVDLSTGNNHFVGSIAVGGPGAQVTFKIATSGNVYLALKDSFTVAAGSTVLIGDVAETGYGASVAVQDSATPPTFVNDGTIVFNRKLVNNDIWASPSNSWNLSGVNNGTIAVQNGRTDLLRGISNNGALTVGNNALVWAGWGSPEPFVQSGTIANAGTFVFSQSVWKQQSGAITGNPVILRSNAVLQDTAGTGSFQLMTARFSGTVPAGQTLLLTPGDGGGSITFDAPSTVAKGGVVTAYPEPYYNFYGATLTNHGTITIKPPAGSSLPTHRSNMEAPLVNAADGIVTVDAATLYTFNAVSNAGTVRTTATGTIWITYNSSVQDKAFTNTGTVTNAGSITVLGPNAGWVQQAGALTGNPVVLRNSAVLTDIGGTGTLNLMTARFSGTVPAGQTLRLTNGDGGGGLTILSPSTVAHGGRIIADDLDGTNYYLQGNTLTNRGVIDLRSNTAAYRLVRLLTALTNAADGSIAVHHGRIDLGAGGKVTNHGLITVDPGAGIGLTQSGPMLVNASDGILRFGIASATSYGVVMNWGSGGALGPLAGTLSGTLVGSYRPAVGTAFPVIQAPHSGTAFAAVTGGFTAAYAADAISLRQGSYPLTAPTPTIAGTAKVGYTLTAKPGAWGPTPVTLKYQWKANGANISGATASTYKITGTYRGKKITVTVTGSRTSYTTTARTSAATAAVAAGTLTAPTPTITGTAKVGYTLTAKTGTWGPTPVTLKYQWKSNGHTISGATKPTLKIPATARGTRITVTATGSRTGYTTVAKTSKPTGVVAAGTLTAPIPTITGTAKVGSTLTAKPGTWGPTPVTLKYQWKSNGHTISGATKPTLKIPATARGTRITVTVTGSRTGYTTVAKTSKPTGVVA